MLTATFSTARSGVFSISNVHIAIPYYFPTAGAGLTPASAASSRKWERV